MPPGHFPGGLLFLGLFCIVLPTMTVRMRHTRSHTKNRRSHHALVNMGTSKCEKCGHVRMPHHACPHCGSYKGRTVVDLAAKLLKRQKKALAKGKEKKEEEAPKETSKK